MIAPEDEMPQADHDVSRAVFEAVAGPKQVIEIEGGRFGLLHHPGDLFDLASVAQRDFLVGALT